MIDGGDHAKFESEARVMESTVKNIRNMNNPRVMPGVSPHAVYTVSEEGLTWCAEFAKNENIPLHVHLSETEQEVTDCVAAHGMRPPAWLDHCGVLSEQCIAAHCCWLDEGECTLLKKRGVSVSHNPASNMKLATHRAMPYPWLSASGVNICLGTDGCASNNNLDLFEEAKIAALLQKFFWNDPTILPAHEALAMATAHGAEALGFGTGRLAVGELADIVLVNSRRVCNTPLHNATSNLVYSCNGGAVETTICNGKILMLEGEIPGESALLEQAGLAAYELVNRARNS